MVAGVAAMAVGAVALGKVVHFEVPVDDPERAAAFYRTTVGWEMEKWAGAPYWLVEAGPDDAPGANGALTGRDAVHRSPVLVVEVDDVDAALERVRWAGGKVLQDRLPVPGVGWSAYVEDTEGNVVGLFSPDPAAS